MYIPQKIKIGGFNIPIEISKDLMIHENKYGNYNTVNHIITISEQASQDQKNNTLCHEIIEGIDSIYDLKLPHDKITIIAAVLHQVLNDNPEIFKEP